MALSRKVIKTTIESTINGWAVANMTYDSTYPPIHWENAPFKPNLNDSNPIYIVPRVQFGASRKLEVGQNGVVNVTGILTCQFVFRANQGSGDAYDLADNFNNYFKDTVFSTVVFQTGTIRSIQDNIDNNLFQVYSEIPFNVHQE